MSEIKTEEQYNDRSDSYEEGAEHYMGEVVVDGLVWGLKNAFYMASYLIGSLTEEMKKNEQGAFEEIEEQQAVIADETPPSRVTGPELVENTGPELVENTGPELVENTGPELAEDTGPELAEDTGHELVENAGHELTAKKNKLIQEIVEEQEKLQQLTEQEKQLSRQLDDTGHELAAKQNKLTQEIAERQKNLQPIKEKEGQLNDWLKKLNGKLSENQGAQSTLTQKYTKNEEQYASIDRQITEGEQHLAVLDAGIEKAKQELAAANTTHEANRRKADSLSGRVRDFFAGGLNFLARGWNTVVKSVGADYLSVSEVSLYSQVADESFKKKLEIDGRLENLKTEMEGKSTNNERVTEQAQSLAEAMEKGEAKLQALKAEEKSLNAKRAKVDASLAILSSAIKDKEQEISEKQNEIQALDKQLNTTKAEVATSLEALSLAIKDKEQKISDKQKEIQALDPQLEVPKPAVQAPSQESRSDNKDANAQTGMKNSSYSKKEDNHLAKAIEKRRASGLDGRGDNVREGVASTDSGYEALFKPVAEQQLNVQPDSKKKKKEDNTQPSQNENKMNDTAIHRMLHTRKDSRGDPVDGNESDDDDWDDKYTARKRSGQGAHGESTVKKDTVQDNAGRSSPTPVVEQKQHAKEITENQSEVQQKKQKAKAELLARDITKSGCLLFNFSHEKELSPASKQQILSQLGSKVAVVLVGDELYCMSKTIGLKGVVLKSEKLSSQQEEQSQGLMALTQQIKDQVGAGEIKEVDANQSAETLSDVVFSLTGIRNKEAGKENVAGVGSAGMEAGQAALLSSDDSRKLRGLLMTCQSRGLIGKGLMSLDFPTQDEDKAVKDERLKRSKEKPVEDRIAELYNEIRGKKDEYFIKQLIDVLTDLGYEDKGLTPEKRLQSPSNSDENQENQENSDPNPGVKKPEMKNVLAAIRNKNIGNGSEVDKSSGPSI